MLIQILMFFTAVTYSWSYPICPHRSPTADQPRFTKRLGEFDYVEYGKPVAIQCCSEGVGDIKWYRLEGGQWKSFPRVQPGISNAPRLEEENQILRIFDADFKDNTTFKCELEPIETGLDGQNRIVGEHQLQLMVVACDQIARGPILTKPFPKDQYIDSFGGNITMPCSGYFGCSDDGTTDGDALWLVKENGHYHYAIHVSPRYSVFKYSNEGKTIKVASLTIFPVTPEDLDRVFVCKVTSPQVQQGQTNQNVRIYKKKGPIDIAKWIGVAVGAVLGLVLVVLLLKVVIGKLWGPQIEWYFRSRVSFVGPKPAEDENLAYNAFLYHDDQDTRMANELKTKLEEQDFVVYLSSDAPPNKPKMATIQEVSSSSAVVIFLYTENLWSDAFSQFLFQCVVEDRKGKGILFLEIEEKFPAQKALDETEKVKEECGRRGGYHTDLSVSVEQDCAHPSHNQRANIDEEIQNVPDEKEGKIDIKFWRALPRLKVPSKESTQREQKNFQCAIQNRLPLLKSQIAAQKHSTSSSSRKSNKSRCSSSGKPLLGENQGPSPGPELSPMSDEVFVNDTGNSKTKFSFVNEATCISRNASVQNSQQDALQGCQQNETAPWQPFILPQFQNEAGASHPMTVSADIHQSNEVPSILTNENGIPTIVAEVHEINETEKEFLNKDPTEDSYRLKLDSLNSDQTGSPSEHGVSTLSGEEKGHLPDNQPERYESGFTEESLNTNQSYSQINNTHNFSQINSNDFNIEPSSFKNASSKKKYQNGLRNQNSEDSGRLNISPGAQNSLGSDHESGYVTSPTTGSLGLSPEGLAMDPFVKLNARSANVKNTINA